MGNKALVHQQKVTDNLSKSYKHLTRLDNAFEALKKSFSFPIDAKDFQKIVICNEYLAYSDQIIYRFSKLQDCMGAKLFKSVLLYQGENVDKPFLDILNRLETLDIINVDEWFELRDLRNEIAHDYEENQETAINIINTIYKLKSDLKETLDGISQLVQKENR